MSQDVGPFFHVPTGFCSRATDSGRGSAWSPIALEGSRFPTRLDGGKLSNGQPSYHDVVFMVQASDFGRLDSALDEVSKEISDPKYR